MANESDLRARVGKLLRTEGFMTQSMETGSTAEGVPDLWYSAVLGPITVAGWMELKKIRELPKRADTPLFRSLNHPLSVEQQNWIEKAIEHGTVVWILVGYDRFYYMVPGTFFAQFNSFTFADICKFSVNKADIPRKLLGT